MAYGKGQMRRKRAPSRPSRRPKTKTKKIYTKGAVSLTNKSGMGMAPLGDRFFTKLKLTNVLPTLSGTLNDKVFKLNSLFDPTQTEGADQPMGYDQIANFFQRYRVYGAKVKWTSINEISNPVGIVACMSTSEDETAFTDLDTVLSRSGNYKVMSGGNGGVCQKTFTRYFSIPEILGVSKQAYKSDIGYSSLVTSEPSSSQSAYVHFTTATLDGTTVLDTRGIYEITFYVEFSERKQLSLS